jgi:hypothetical protein
MFVSVSKAGADKFGSVLTSQGGAWVSASVGNISKQPIEEK